MKKSDVKEWVKALRSNEYRQGKGSLCVEDEINGESYYCCLGVACDMLVDEDWIKGSLYGKGGWSIGENIDFDIPRLVDKYNWGSTGTTRFPSMSLLEEMGLDPVYAQQLAELNDKGFSFKRIADKIEKDLLK